MRSQDGFTLIEVLASILLISLLITAVYSPQIKNRVDDYHLSVANTIADEIYNIGNAAQIYLTKDADGKWPDEDRECGFAIDVLQEQGYLPPQNIIPFPARSPMYQEEISSTLLPFDVHSSQVSHIGQYYTECPEELMGSGNRNHFYIRYAFAEAHNKYTGYINNQLPLSNPLRKDDVRGVEVAIPIPAAIPILDALLAHDGSRIITGDLDVGQNVIANARDIELTTGQTLGSVTMETLIASPGSIVSKPKCPAEYIPTIIVMPSTIAHSSGYPIVRADMYATDDGKSWKIKSKVYASNGNQPEIDYSQVRGAVITRCIR